MFRCLSGAASAATRSLISNTWDRNWILSCRCHLKHLGLYHSQYTTSTAFCVIAISKSIARLRTISEGILLSVALHYLSPLPQTRTSISDTFLPITSANCQPNSSSDSLETNAGPEKSLSHSLAATRAS